MAREHHRRGLPLSVIVVDYFHWTRQGEWKFDTEEWPDPQAMVDELKALGVELMVSVWPTVNPNSAHYSEMEDRGFLVGSQRGMPLHLPFWDKGTDGHALPASTTRPTREPGSSYGTGSSKGTPVTASVCSGSTLASRKCARSAQITSSTTSAKATRSTTCTRAKHARGFAEGLRGRGEEQPLVLCRSAWAGSQRYGAAVWSGDIDSSFEALAAQIPAGLNIGDIGIPWWTTDIGGFKGGDPSTPYFRELVVRWFQFSVFCPLFRLHGVREPGPLVGSGQTGAPNEVWSFGDEAYEIIRDQLALRERLRPYVMDQMATASATGLPPMRAMFLEFPEEPTAWELSDQFMFGPDILVAPVTTSGAESATCSFPLAPRGWTLGQGRRSARTVGSRLPHHWSAYRYTCGKGVPSTACCPEQIPSGRLVSMPGRRSANWLTRKMRTQAGAPAHSPTVAGSRSPADGGTGSGGRLSGA